MKSVQPNRPKRRRRLFIASAALALVLAPVQTRAADDTHWLVPSQRSINKETLFSSGYPALVTAGPALTDARVVTDGAVLYAVHCSSCHGSNLAGTGGAPSLLSAGGAGVDFYMTTGRMPLALRAENDAANHSPLGATSASGVQAYHVPALFDPRQTAAIDAYVDARATQRTSIPKVRIDPAKLQRGRLLFEDNCQACHGAAAQGATAGEQWVALPLDVANPTQIGEAIRIGPGVMPRFSERQLPDGDLDAVATYVLYVTHEQQTYGGAVMEYLGPISEGAVSAVIGVGFLFWVIYFTGTKADGRRVNELD